MTLYKLIQLSVFFSFIYGISYASTVSTPAKNSGIVVSHTPTHKKEFIGLSHPEALAKASELKAYLVDLENRKMGKHDSIDPKYYRKDFKKLSQIEAIEICASLKEQIMTLENELGLASATLTPLNTPIKSVVSSSALASTSSSGAAEQAQLEEISRKLDALLSREVRALRVHSDSTARNLSAELEQHAAPEDAIIARIFKNDKPMIAAYKQAVQTKNLTEFWKVVKAKTLSEITACIQKIQPGNSDSVLLNEYSSGIGYYMGAVVKDVKKQEFLGNLNKRIAALDFSKIALPADQQEASLTHFYTEFMRQIKTAIDTLVDESIAGEHNTIVLPNDVGQKIEPMTNIRPATTKGAFKFVLEKAAENTSAAG